MKAKQTTSAPRHTATILLLRSILLCGLRKASEFYVNNLLHQLLKLCDNANKTKAVSRSKLIHVLWKRLVLISRLVVCMTRGATHEFGHACFIYQYSTFRVKWKETIKKSISVVKASDCELNEIPRSLTRFWEWVQLLRVRVWRVELACVKTADKAYHIARNEAANSRRSRHVLSDHFIGNGCISHHVAPCKPITLLFLLSTTIITSSNTTGCSAI